MGQHMSTSQESFLRAFGRNQRQQQARQVRIAQTTSAATRPRVFRVVLEEPPAVALGATVGDDVGAKIHSGGGMGSTSMPMSSGQGLCAYQ